MKTTTKCFCVLFLIQPSNLLFAEEKPNRFDSGAARNGHFECISCGMFILRQRKAKVDSRNIYTFIGPVGAVRFANSGESRVHCVSSRVRAAQRGTPTGGTELVISPRRTGS